MKKTAIIFLLLPLAIAARGAGASIKVGTCDSPAPVISQGCDIIGLHGTGGSIRFTENSGYEGIVSGQVAIVYKPSVLECLQSGSFWLGGVLERPEQSAEAPSDCLRPAVWARMRHRASGNEFYFLSTQLVPLRKLPDGTINYDGNKFNSQQLRKWCDLNLEDDVPGILTGEMNIDEGDRAWAHLAQAPFMDVKLFLKNEGKLSPEASGRESRHIMFLGFRPADYLSGGAGSPVCSNLEFWDYSTDGPPMAPKARKTVRTMSFNVRYFNNNVDYENGWAMRCRAIPAMLEDVAPDVMGTQEITDYQIAYLDRRCPGYGHVGIFREPEGWKECASVYYNRETMVLMDWGGFHLSETPSVPSLGWDAAIKRTAVWARLRIKGSRKEILFVNTHLDHKGQEAREKGLALILDTLKVINKWNLPYVIVGDLNMTAGNKGLERISAEMNDARKTAVSSDDMYSFNGFGKSWTGKIDYIWYQGFRKCLNFRVINKEYLHIKYISDHYPIIADLRL